MNIQATEEKGYSEGFSYINLNYDLVFTQQCFKMKFNEYSMFYSFFHIFCLLIG